MTINHYHPASDRLSITELRPKKQANARSEAFKTTFQTQIQKADSQD